MIEEDLVQYPVSLEHKENQEEDNKFFRDVCINNISNKETD